jgi:hypothetical protein
VIADINELRLYRSGEQTERERKREMLDRAE